MHQTIESDDELISETVKGADGADASPSGTSLKEQVYEKRRGKETHILPRIQTEVGALEKELNELQLQCKKMDLLKQIEKCREKIANHQTGGNQATPQLNILHLVLPNIFHAKMCGNINILSELYILYEICCSRDTKIA